MLALDSRMGYVGFFVIGLAGIWVYRDASKIDWSDDRIGNKPWQWALGVLFVWPIFLPLYFLRRHKKPRVA